MPLGSLIGSNQGLKMRTLIEILIEEIEEIPIIVDAGIGQPSHASEAMEIGADAVLVNTAVAAAENPVLMAVAFARGIEAGRMAYLAKAGRKQTTASASSPLTGFLYDE
jgi:thiazole synthase